jgi:hypothetical protein
MSPALLPGLLFPTRPCLRTADGLDLHALVQSQVPAPGVMLDVNGIVALLVPLLDSADPGLAKILGARAQSR